MEIEKVIRIVALFILAAAFAVHVASRLLFAAGSSAADIPIAVGLILGLINIWTQTSRPSRHPNNDSNE